jgi:ABC-type transport system substrate-binding protein
MSDNDAYDEIRSRVKKAWQDAHDFDPRDPLFGLTRDEMSGPRLSRRATLRLLAAGGVLSMAHLLPGTTRQAVAAGAGGELSCGWSGVAEIVTLDPAQINQVLQFQVASNVFSGLMHIDANLVAQGDLAENWEVSDDGTIYTFKLREGVTFHNGDAFTADDVLFTFTRSSDPEQSIHSKVIANVANLEKLNDFEVRFTLNKPQASFLPKALERASGRAMTIVSKGALETLGDSQYGLMPVGTGPFKVVEHQLGQGVVLEKFADYFDPERPLLDKITIKPIDGPEPLAAAIEAGDIQYIGGNPLPAQLVERFQKNPDLNVDIKPAPGFQSVWLNPWRDVMSVSDFNKPLEELKTEKGFMVRMALAKALDRELFVKQALFGNGVPAYGTINPAMGFYYDESVGEKTEQAFDPEGAKELMAAAGYPDGKDFPALDLVTTPSQKRYGLVIANIYKQVLGITVNVVTKEFSVQIEEFNKMDFDMRLGGSGGDYDPDDGLIDWMITDSKFNGPTRDKEQHPFGFFSDSEIDAIITEQSVTAEPDARKELVQKANLISSNKVACAFLYHPVDVQVYHTSVNFPAESRIPGLHDFDRVSVS